MNKKYDFIDIDNWNGESKTVWTYKKQEKIIKNILEKYPTPISLRKKLLNSNNNDAKEIGKYINPNWSRNHYIKFIETNIIKYSNIGKILISQIVGGGIGLGLWYGSKQLIEPKHMEDYVFKNNKTPSSDEIINRIGSYTVNEKPKTFINTYSPSLIGFTGKGLGSGLTYSFLNKIDKKNVGGI